MGDVIETKLEVKLDILIEDFQRFRQEQLKHNKESSDSSNEENITQASILTTLRWHTIIGSFMVGVIMYLLYLHAKIGG